jgi:hypothetical protein
MQSPGCFSQLGQDLATLDHLISVWRFRFPPDKRRTVGADDLAVILRDFEASLGANISAAQATEQARLSA